MPNRIRHAAPSAMSAEEFRLALAARSLNQRGFAALSGRNERTIRRYAAGKAPVPKWAQVLLTGK